jgi:hypothetical protein
MAVKIVSEQQVIREATEVLLERLSPAKVVRFWATWQIGTGDYQDIREQVFAGETVQTLYEKVHAYQEIKGQGN